MSLAPFEGTRRDRVPSNDWLNVARNGSIDRGIECRRLQVGETMRRPELANVHAAGKLAFDVPWIPLRPSVIAEGRFDPLQRHPGSLRTIAAHRIVRISDRENLTPISGCFLICSNSSSSSFNSLRRIRSPTPEDNVRKTAVHCLTRGENYPRKSPLSSVKRQRSQRFYRTRRLSSRHRCKSQRSKNPGHSAGSGLYAIQRSTSPRSNYFDTRSRIQSVWKTCPRGLSVRS